MHSVSMEASMQTLDLDPIHRLNNAVQSVKQAANHFPLGKQLAAQKAAAQVLLDHLPVGYRIWPIDEDLKDTLDRLTHDFVATARDLQMTDDDGESTITRTLDRLLHQLGYVRSTAGIEVLF
jgi:hypothetical protein